MPPLELRPFQRQALAALEAPGHVIAVAHTGAGKSLVYERAAAQPGRRTLLVTPLTALARQQAASLAAAGLSTALGAGGAGGRPGPETRAWIVSPEMLRYPAARETLRRWGPDLLVVDECHCLWEWGEAFRPDFLRLPGLLQDSSFRRSLWLSATLPPGARRELRHWLSPGVREVGRFSLPPTLHLAALRAPWPDRLQLLLGWIAGRQGAAGIVFVPTRAASERIHRVLHAAGKRSLAYHAGLSLEERRSAENRIRNREPEVIVATPAFGMGLDFPHLRWAVLWQAPGSLLGLAQAVGRVARDSQTPARALILWDPDDFKLLDWTLGSSTRRKDELQAVAQMLQSPGCRRAALERYFEDAPPNPRCGQRCDVCLG